MAELTRVKGTSLPVVSCCAPEKQANCCTPAEKAKCCQGGADGCGCQGRGLVAELDRA